MHGKILIWMGAAWLAVGFLASVWSYRSAPRPERWALGFLATMFLWPLAFVRYAIELIERTHPGSRSLDDLILIRSWHGSLVAIVAGSVLSFFLFGFWWPYWRIADMDFWMVYEGWLFGSGLPQEWFDHPGYLTSLLIGYWFRFLNALGLLDAHSLAAATSAPDPGHAWTTATQAGRLLSLVLSMGFVIAFASLLRVIVKDWRIAFLAAFLLAFSGGLTMQARIMRTELLAGAAVSIAFLLLVIAARSERSIRPVLVGLAGFVAMLGFINKTQVLPMICALPIMIMPFGRADTASGSWQPSARTMLATAALGVAALAVAIPAAALILSGISQASSAGWQPFLFGTYGAYQAAIAIWIVVSVVVFALVWRLTPIETIATLLCLLLGISLAVLTLELRPHPTNVVIAANPLEHLFVYAKASNPQNSGLLTTALELAQGLVTALRVRTFFLDTSARPAIFLEWMVIAGTIMAWRAGKRTLVLQVVLLMCAVLGTDAISALRGMKQQYFILTDPLTVIAAALLVAELPVLQKHRYVFPVGVALLATHVAVSHAEPIKHTFMTSKPLAFCVNNFGIKRFPFCPPP